MDALIAPPPDLSEFEIPTPDTRGLPSGEAMAQYVEMIDAKSFKWAYWRKPNGDLTIAPAWPNEMVQQYEEGWTLLRKYGRFQLSEPKEGWRTGNEPWRRLFQLGGAGEFTVEEVLAHGWHRHPPYRGITFPQLTPEVLAKVKANEAQCVACRRWYLDASELTKHQSVAHRDISNNEQLARSMSKNTKDSNEALASVVEGLTEAIKQQGEFNQRILTRLNERTPVPTGKR